MEGDEGMERGNEDTGEEDQTKREGGCVPEVYQEY